MSETKHPWCSDVSRDEAIRAAEDAAAQWRRLEVGEVIEAGDQFNCEEKGWVETMCEGDRVTKGSEYYRRRRVPPPDHRDLPSAVHDLRRRVEGLEAVADHWRRQCEAEAENREAVPGLREGVTAAPAANAGGEANCPAAPDSSPQPPRGWLTSEEREALKWFCGGVWPISAEQAGQWRTAIQSLLARSTPPRVKVPVVVTGFTHREHAEGWVKAIREAGGEVEE